MCAHREGMNARVGSAGGDDLACFAGHPLQSFLQSLLDGRAMLLTLPAHERAAVIFDRQSPPAHGRMLPLVMGKPRSNSPALIGARPARWTRRGWTMPE